VKVKCEGCLAWHNVSPTAMAIIIYAMQSGDLQRVTRKGIRNLCLGDALNPDTLHEWRHRLDSKSVVQFDDQQWTDGRRKRSLPTETAA
jgi:hypothetical protein